MIPFGTYRTPPPSTYRVCNGSRKLIQREMRSREGSFLYRNRRRLADLNGQTRTIYLTSHLYSAFDPQPTANGGFTIQGNVLRATSRSLFTVLPWCKSCSELSSAPSTAASPPLICAFSSPLPCRAWLSFSSSFHWQTLSSSESADF